MGSFPRTKQAVTTKTYRMIEKLFESAGLNGKVQAPQTPEEFDSLAKRIGACLDEAVANVLYRGVLADFRGELCDKIEATHSIKRLTKDHPEGKKDAAGNTIRVVDESENKYIARAAAELGQPVNVFQPLADEVCKDLVFDPSQRERKAGAGMPGKTDLETARTLIAQGPEKLAISLGKIGAVTGTTITLTGDEAAQVVQVALAIKAYRAAITSATALKA